MLSFSTEFPIWDSDIAACVSCVRDWLLGSPHTSFTAELLSGRPATGRWTAETPTERIEALLPTGGREKIAAFRHNLFARDLTWETEIVFSISEDSSFVGIRTSRQSEHAQVSLPRAKKPHVIKTILAELGGGLDGEIYVQDEPHFVGEKDAGMVVRLINGDADNYLPVIYVSRTFQNQLMLRPEPLARRMSGLAHVVVEPSRAFSRIIQPDVGGRNAYGGRIGMHWPSGQSFYLAPESFVTNELDLRRLIEGRISDALLNRRPLARCTWAKAEAEFARETIELLRSAGSGDIDEYIRAFDDELAAKDRQLRDAEEEIWKLQARLKTDFQQKAHAEATLAGGEELDFFPGETREIIADALGIAVANVQHDSRRQHVLSSVLDAISGESQLPVRKEKLKEALRGYASMTRDVSEALTELGFSVSEDGKHYKLTYMDDDRYTFALPKSGSDHRGGLNAASDISKRVF
jgi:hypothetical protein